MPDISFPEVRLKDKLPEGFRELSIDDIQKAIPDVRLPHIDLGTDARKAGKAAEKAARGAAKAAEKAAAEASKQADRMARDARKSAGREMGKVAKAAEGALPRRAGPNPVPIAILAMLGGAVVGWLLATSPTTGPRISAWLDDLRRRFDDWRGRRGSDLEDDDWDTADESGYLGPIGSDAGVGVGVGPGTLTEDPTSPLGNPIGVNERSL